MTFYRRKELKNVWSAFSFGKKKKLHCHKVNGENLTPIKQVYFYEFLTYEQTTCILLLQSTNSSVKKLLFKEIGSLRKFFFYDSFLYKNHSHSYGIRYFFKLKKTDKKYTQINWTRTEIFTQKLLSGCKILEKLFSEINNFLMLQK